MYKLAQHYKHSDGLTAHVYTPSGYTLRMRYKLMNSHNNILTPIHSYVNHITWHDPLSITCSGFGCILCFALVYIFFESSTEVDNLDVYIAFHRMTITTSKMGTANIAKMYCVLNIAVKIIILLVVPLL